MKPRLESDLLRTFVAVAETGSFTRAAEMVGRTQSAISMQIKKLESIVSGELFARGSRGVGLTRQGEKLLANATRIVALLDETESSLSAAPLDGPVRIGIPESYGQSVLSQALGAFAKRHPRVEVTVRHGHSDLQMAAVERGELDIAVVFQWEGAPQGEVLTTDPSVWVTSDMHGVHERTPVPVALYDNLGWSRDFAIRSLRERGIQYRVAYLSSSTDGIKLAVSAGLGIAPMSRSNIPAGCRELLAAEGYGDIDASRVVLHRRPGAPTDAMNGMIEAIREAFGGRPAMSQLAG
jgi:DNA-binding transcriptional LysR family regulator